MYARASMAALSRRPPDVSQDDATCAIVGEVKFNNIFYRTEPQAMRRYSALALDNIRREPLGFLKASLFRVYRVFVVVGSKDKWTNQQFSGATLIYGAATAASLVFLALFIAGVVISWRRGADVLLPLLLILYIPATIAPLLTNMRYSVTVQPLMFVFVAAALGAAFRAVRRKSKSTSDLTTLLLPIECPLMPGICEGRTCSLPFGCRFGWRWNPSPFFIDMTRLVYYTGLR